MGNTKYVENFIKNNNLIEFRKALSLLVEGCCTSSAKGLDFGCGNGHAMAFCKNYGQIYGVDIDDESLNLAKEHGEVVKVAPHSSYLPFPDEMFDFIISINSLHHILNIEESICQLYRVLGNGGGVLIHEIVENSFYIKFGRNIYPKYKNMDVCSRFTYQQLIQILEKNGFEILGVYAKYLSTLLRETIYFNLRITGKFFFKRINPYQKVNIPHVLIFARKPTINKK